MNISQPVRVFYESLGEGRYHATEHTVGPWSDKAQHLGPVSALLVRELERFRPRQDMAIRRVGVDVLGPVPVGELDIHTEMTRPGRSVELVSATLSAEGRPAATARAWRMVRGDTTSIAAEDTEPFDSPESWAPMPTPDGWTGGYASALEWRIADESMLGTGHARVWARPKMPLLGGEEPTALQRLFAVADCSSGVSSRLRFREWTFANTDLTVHLSREPRGEWIGLDARMDSGPDGAGLAHSTLHDTAGPVGRSAQSLLLAPR
ncbi:thioesterase superfamily protein [Halopolyspora algeriensis]|uniref:Thioesterase superfamily protein n=1 Tax=Halopolyspora algeriensis TaxID=1500506 RepID=A0A368VIG1_9ACTN|nr:thioesterase family protein [Halopolyspora algeriensis]RCW40454.1 thioesterase superfamily protein [Halopolyspora algeriensis]TQM53737.1 thioesterase superfamily protein [Halopolyspora algeriensis]